MTHPYDPASPLYQEMVDAGRTGPYRFGGPDALPYGGTRTCQATITHEVNGRTYWTRCPEPIAYRGPHHAVPWSQIHYCIAHGIEEWDYGVRSGTFTCSVCGYAVRYPSHLDSAGRCAVCAP